VNKRLSTHGSRRQVFAWRGLVIVAQLLDRLALVSIESHSHTVKRCNAGSHEELDHLCCHVAALRPRACRLGWVEPIALTFANRPVTPA
jgi:hypothetical protein